MASRLLRLLFLAGTVTFTSSLKLDDCSYRMTDWSNDGGTGKVVTIECFTDEDIYFKKTSGPMYKTTDKEFDTPLRLGDGPVLPAPAMLWTGNFQMTCGSVTFQSIPPERYPTDYLFVGDPVENPVGNVMVAFGAKLLKTPFIDRKLAFHFFPEMKFIDPEEQSKLNIPITPSDFEACVSAGTAKIKWTGIDSSAIINPVESYYMTDSSGIPPNPGETNITKQDLASLCDKSTVFGIKAAFENVLAGLRKAETRIELSAERALITGLMGGKEFAACYALMQTMYNTEDAQVTLPGSTACQHSFNTSAWRQDPCCNPILAWSQCCVPGEKIVTTPTCVEKDDVCIVNDAAVGVCSAETQEDVKFGIQEVVAASVFEVNHPEYGCRIKADEVSSHDLWRQNSEDWANVCADSISHGKTYNGQQTCTLDSDCFTSCETDPWDTGTKRCKAVEGGEAIRPLLRCMLFMTKPLMVAKHIGALLGATIGAGPDRLNEDLPDDDPIFAAAAAEFEKQVAENNCAGLEVGANWCQNSLSKADCQSLQQTENVDSPTGVKWIDDPSDSNVGWCVQTMPDYRCSSDPSDSMACGWGHSFSWLFDDQAQAACDAATKTLQAFVVAPGGAGTGTMTQYGAGTFHRLQTTELWAPNPDTGNYEPVKMYGDQQKCLAERACNWDPRGKEAKTEAECTGKIAPASVMEGGIGGTMRMMEPGPEPEPAPGAEEPRMMFCGRCGKDYCETMMSLPTCVVKPWGYQMEDTSNPGTCESTNGGGLPAATYDENTWKTRGRMVHSRCYRNGTDFDTEAECLPPSICPKPESDQWGHTWSACGEPICYIEGAKKTDCENWPNNWYQSQFSWWPDWANGTGLCASWGFFSSVSACESFQTGLSGATAKYWEGRQWRPGWMTTRETCETGFCQDDMPGQEFRTTCDSSKKCTRRCSLCESDRRWDGIGSDRICFDPSITSAASCVQPMEWDNKAEKCKKSRFIGNNTECIQMNASYVYRDCSSFSEAQCKAGCKLSGFTNESDCEQNGEQTLRAAGCATCGRPRWDWEEETCRIRDGVESQASCLGLDSSASPEWTVTDTEMNKIRNALQCRWDNHAECPNKESCEASGWCEDWSLNGYTSEYSGACIKTIAPNAEGEREDCYAHPSGKLEFAGSFGCRVKTAVTEEACTAMGAGYVWMKKAKDRAECDGHGKYCRDRYEEHKVFGGFTTEQACEGCGDDRVFVKKAHFSAGVWQAPSMMRGTWQEREWGIKNEWVPMISRSLLRSFAERAMAKLVGEVYWSEMNCLISPLILPLLLTACSCGTGTTPSACVSLMNEAGDIEVPLAEATLECGNLAATPPQELASGSVSYSSMSMCVGDAVGQYITERITKRVVKGDSSTRRLSSHDARRLSACAQHAIITDAQGAVTGQKMGVGLSSSVANATMCIVPSVPSNQVCAEYTVNDFVSIDTNGTLSTPLGLTTTTDAQGRYCATMPSAGTFMPIKRSSDSSSSSTTTGAQADGSTSSAASGGSGGSTSSTASGGSGGGQDSTTPQMPQATTTSYSMNAVISGSMQMTMAEDKIDAAIADPVFKDKIEESIAEKANVDKQHVDATLSKGSRRLTQSIQRRLAATLNVAYTMTLPASSFSAAQQQAAHSSLTAVTSSSLQQTLNTKLASTNYTVTVTSVTQPTIQTQPAPSPAISTTEAMSNDVDSTTTTFSLLLGLLGLTAARFHN